MVEPVIVEDPAPVPPIIGESLASPAAPTRTITRRQPRPVARPIALNRADEYRFIRADLNRLLVTASALLLVMLALLVVVER